MSKFSEHLEQCIRNSGLTEKQLAQVSGFSRSYIALMRNGQRVSPDIGKTMKLLHVLNLPPHEFDEIWSEYIRARVGDDIYERDLAILDLLESFENISPRFVKSAYKHEIPNINTVDNQMTLEYLIRAVIEQEAVKKNGSVHIIMQADVSILRSILPNVCKNNAELRIDHIICMDNQMGSSHDKLYNLKMLRAVMPIVIFSNSRNYKIYHYYDCVESHFNTASLMPYIVLTKDYVINMNVQMNSGIIIREKEIIDLYERMFQKHKRVCRLLFRRIENQQDICDYYNFENRVGETFYTIAQQPSFGMLKVDGLVRKYYIRGNGKHRIFMEVVMKKNEKLINGGYNKIVCCCTKHGLLRFAKQGVIDELPGEMYHRLEIEDRLEILKKLLKAIKQGTYELHLVGEYRISLPKELFVTSYGIMDAILMYLSDDVKARFILNENSLTKILYEFFQDYVKNSQNSNADNAVHYIEQLIAELTESTESDQSKMLLEN